jgi:DNA-binding CsgD family transcriptional regulator
MKIETKLCYGQTPDKTKAFSEPMKLARVDSGLAILNDPACRFFSAGLCGASGVSEGLPRCIFTRAEAFKGDELDILSLKARGLSNAQIGKKLFKSEGVIRNTLSALYRRLGLTNETHAVLVAIDRGDLDLDDITAGPELKRYHDLTPGQQALMDKILEKNGRDNAAKSLVNTRSRSGNGLRNQLGEIYGRLGVNGKTQAAVLCLAAKRGLADTKN